MRKVDAAIAAFFDDCARKGYMETFDAEEEARLDDMIDGWDIRPGDRVLEPGCGSGRLTGRLAAAVGSDGEVYACDLSPLMIGKGRTLGLPDQVRWVLGSVEQVDVADGHFDEAICFSVFPHFSDVDLALAEIHRVLKPGGHLWINHLKTREQLNDMHDASSGLPVAHPIPDHDTITGILDGAGFTVLALEDSEETGYSLHAVRR